MSRIHTGAQAFDENAEGATAVQTRLKNLYNDSLLPVEKKFLYDTFFGSDVEFDAKPQVLLIGPNSVGKTSFISYLLGRDFPGQKIAPDPSSDRFTVLFDGPEERVLSGNEVTTNPDLPFHSLRSFGDSFVNVLQGSQVPSSSVLKCITIIDTPGILSGVNRGYEINDVVSSFAERADLIILFFDAHEFEISNEFKGAIDVLKGREAKIRCILNKADQIEKQDLMRVHGEILWTLGTTMNTPKVPRVYVGSFWGGNYLKMDNADLFDLDEKDLLKDLADLPSQSAARKHNEFAKRTRMVKTLAFILSYLKSQMPPTFGKDAKKDELIKSMGDVFRLIQAQQGIPSDDFPEMTKFKENLCYQDFDKFPSLAENEIEDISAVENEIKNGLASVAGGEGWALQEYADSLYESFQALGPEGGMLSRTVSINVIKESGLGSTQMSKIWSLSDMDQSGCFNHYEYVVAKYLCDEAKKGNPIPDMLPASLVPPSK